MRARPSFHGMVPMAVGWRVTHTEALLVTVSGDATAPNVIHRESVALITDPKLREPYHAAAHLPASDAQALIEV